MVAEIKLFLIITGVLQSDGVSLRRQLEHIADAQYESQGLQNEILPSRRTFYQYDPRELSKIIGLPSMPSHLPEAESILPGHTLIKPALGMLKSSMKFPHKELEGGFGVYGNVDNIGIRYDSKNERVLYSGFRRMPSDYLMVMPSKSGNSTQRFSIASAVLDLDKEEDMPREVMKLIDKLDIPSFKGKVKIFVPNEADFRAPDPTIRSNNKISLYLKDNKEPLSKKNDGRIYLRRIHLTKPVSARNNHFERRFDFDIEKIVDDFKNRLKNLPSCLQKIGCGKKKNSTTTSTGNYKAID